MTKMTREINNSSSKFNKSVEQFNKINEDINLQINRLNFISSQKLNFIKYKFNTELINAIRESNIFLVKMILENGADPNYNVPNPAIIIAANQNNHGIIKLLLEYGADPYTTDSFGDSYLEILDSIGEAINFISRENITEIIDLMANIGHEKRTRIK